MTTKRRARNPFETTDAIMMNSELAVAVAAHDEFRDALVEMFDAATVIVGDDD